MPVQARSPALWRMPPRSSCQLPTASSAAPSRLELRRSSKALSPAPRHLQQQPESQARHVVDSQSGSLVLYKPAWSISMWAQVEPPPMWLKVQPSQLACSRRLCTVLCRQPHLLLAAGAPKRRRIAS